MADDEQFSLCWNNFNTNLSAGFHESLCRGDLVDVTLAAEGQFVKAHRLVLSVCSPYFRKMFTTMPANQHAFVFLKDVSHSALKDLIQFMYCGEVNVKQDALPAFISTAEALQIKGLTDGDPAPPSQSPTKPSTPAHQTLTRVRQPATRSQQTPASSRSYKIETIEDSGDEVLVGGKTTTTQIVLQTTAPPPQQQQQPQQASQQPQNVVQTTTTNQGTTVVSQKRPAGQRSISSAQAKRIKTQTVVSVQQNDPLEAVGATETTTLQAVQSVASAADKSDNEFIDLPIDLPTKSEPDYSNAEDAGDVDAAGEADTYVEDDSYGDMKYDESYFTENEDQTATGGAATSVSTSTPAIKQQQFGETSYTESGDQSGAEAQAKNNEPTTIQIAQGPKKRGRPKNGGKKPASGKEKLEELYAAALKKPSVPAMYVSTTRGSMKLNYEGHHFFFKYKRGPYTLFNCCFKENGEECKVRAIVCNQRVYHLDGEHVHFRQAVDKSATSVAFEVDTGGDDTGEENKNKPGADDIAQEIFDDLEKDDYSSSAISAPTKQPIKILNSQAGAKPLKSSPQGPGVKQEQIDPEDFKEKIKRRLQNALLKKK